MGATVPFSNTMALIYTLLILRYLSEYNELLLLTITYIVIKIKRWIKARASEKESEYACIAIQ
jgi:hypothetical protein